MAELATLPASHDKLDRPTTRVSAAMLAKVEAMVVGLGARFEPPAQFVVPGQTPLAAQLDLARTVVRRAEREAVAATVDGSLVLPYLNRLSSLLGAGLLGRGRAPVRPGRAVRGWLSASLPREAARTPTHMSIAIELTRTLDRAVDAVGTWVFVEQLDGEEAADGSDRDRRPRRRRASTPAPWRRGVQGQAGRVVRGAGRRRRGGGALGLGPRGDATVATYRKAAAALARATTRQAHLAIDLLDHVPEHLERPDVAQALTEGVVLGAYRYTALKSDPEPHHVESLTVVGRGAKRVQTALSGAGRWPRRCAWPATSSTSLGGTLTPTAFATCRGAGRPAALRGRACPTGKYREEGLGGLLGVNRGSTEQLRFVQLSWQPDRKPCGTVALVGKGIMLDSGGLSLKTADGMIGMKGDMAGAAAVLATFSALETVHLLVRALGFLLTDNMPGGDATRVGDVLRIRNGKTVEVLNTDAEGLRAGRRWSLASEAELDAIVDLATLRVPAWWRSA